eukprot:TRINITY_DN27938_c0_g1_i1.p1 TRINITY_DN27938_c0_g1~~TRINITY_DN27938_c0_g1_i1.p1  ORF type:complete len:267 (-),score=24.37 TRINITY_DN27938_c0_g1_i1:53-811(-)
MLSVQFLFSTAALFIQHGVSEDTTMVSAGAMHMDDECSTGEACTLSALQTKSMAAATDSETLQESCDSWGCSCQGVSDCFGVIYSMSWGAASPAAQAWYIQSGCTTRPSGSGCKSKPATWHPPGTQGQNIWTVYHTTSFATGPKILKHGFKPGRVGWCGGGIYFATSREGTTAKAIGVDSSQGFLIEAKVDVGKIWYQPWNCFTDQACIVSHPGVQGHLSCMSKRTFSDVKREVHGRASTVSCSTPETGMNF